MIFLICKIGLNHYHVLNGVQTWSGITHSQLLHKLFSICFFFLYQTQYKLVPELKNLVTNVLKLPILLNIQRSGRCSRGKCLWDCIYVTKLGVPKSSLSTVWRIHIIQIFTYDNGFFFWNVTLSSKESSNINLICQQLFIYLCF